MLQSGRSNSILLEEAGLCVLLSNILKRCIFGVNLSL